MKKSFKSILCLLFALVFVFQFISAAAPSAFADEGEEEEEGVELSYSIKVGGNNYTGPVSLEALKEGLEIIPSEKAFIRSVSINGTGVTGYAMAEGRKLVIDSDAILDMLSDETIDKDAETFSISAVVEELDETLKSITAPAADKAELGENEEFVCWKYRYDNKAIVLVEAEDTFQPFMGCERVGAISREVEAEGAEDNTESEEPEGEFKAVPKLATMPLMAPPPGTKYEIKIIPTDAKMEYTGENASCPTDYTLEIKENGTIITDPVELAKFSLSTVKLGLSKDGTVGDFKAIGKYDIVVTNLSNISVSHESDDISSVAFLSSSEGEFEITKVKLLLKPVAVSKEYDGEVLKGEYEAVGLLPKHVISGVRYDGEIAAICIKTYTLSPESKIDIENDNCDKVNDIYDVQISTDPAAYVITAPKTKTKLTVKAVDVSKDYTGNPVAGSINELEGLPEGAVVTAEYHYQDEHTAIGSHKYSLVSVTITLDGHDISSAFDIDKKTTEATLKITGHKYSITIKDAVKDYDGKPLKASDFLAEGLLEGHKIDKASLVFIGEQTDAGISESDVSISSIRIVDASDNDVSGFYETPTVTRGNLTVNKLAFTVTAKDANHVYNGKPLTCNEYTISGTDKAKLDKLGAWTLNVVVSGSRTEVGSSVNKVGTVELKVGDTVVDPKNYEVTRVDGKLTVEADSTKPTVTITVESKSKVYDGTALLLDPKAYTISDTLPTGYSMEVTLEKASITAVGSIEVSVKEYKVYKNNVLVTDPAKYDFNIALKNGTLKVTKYPITITAQSGSKYYNGKEFVLNSVTITAPNNKLVDGQKAEITVEAQDGAGNKVKAIKVGKYYNVVTQVVIKEGNKDVTANYDITTVNGTLTIKNSNGNPATGDTSNISLWATVLAVSAVAVVCIVVIVLLRNKKKSN